MSSLNVFSICFYFLNLGKCSNLFSCCFAYSARRINSAKMWLQYSRWIISKLQYYFFLLEKLVSIKMSLSSLVTNHSTPCLKLCLTASSYHQYDAPKAIPKDLNYSHTKNIECIVWFCPDFLPAVPNDYKVMRLKCAGRTRHFLYFSPNFALLCSALWDAWRKTLLFLSTKA